MEDSTLGKIENGPEFKLGRGNYTKNAAQAARGLLQRGHAEVSSYLVCATCFWMFSANICQWQEDGSATLRDHLDTCKGYRLAQQFALYTGSGLEI